MERCQQGRVSLNLANCAFGVTGGTLLKHIVRWEGITIDPDKVKEIMDAPPLKNIKALNRFLGQIKWHSWMIWYLANVVTPLYAVVDKVPFQWTTGKEYANDCLKKMLSKTCVVQPPDWGKYFHVFIDASDVTIGSLLMQLLDPNRYRLVYFASRKLSIADRNYSTTQREAPRMIYRVKKF